MLPPGAWFDSQSPGRSHGTVIDGGVKWSGVHFRKFTLVTKVEDQWVERSRNISVEAVTQIRAKTRVREVLFRLCSKIEMAKCRIHSTP